MVDFYVLEENPLMQKIFEVKLQIGTSDIPQFVFDEFYNKGVVVLRDDLFFSLIIHACVQKERELFFEKNGFISFHNSSITNPFSVSRVEFVTETDYYLYQYQNRESNDIVELFGNKYSKLLLENSNLRDQVSYARREKVSRTQTFESYNVFKRVWLAITKQVIF